MSLQVEGTILVITGMGIAPYSARGLSQQLALVANAGNLTRSINGRAQNWNMAQFEKYATTITCTDQMVPALDGIWPGDEFVMECACNLSYPVGGTAQRDAVSGSEFTDNGFVFYRPILDVQFQSFDYTFDEWGASVGWTMSFVEV